MLDFGAIWSDLSFWVSVFSIYNFVVACNEVFWNVLRWFKRVIFGSIPVPYHDLATVMAIDLICYGTGDRIFWSWQRDFTNTLSRLFRYCSRDVCTLLLGELDVFAFSEQCFCNLKAAVTMYIDTVFCTPFSSIAIMWRCTLMVWLSRKYFVRAGSQSFICWVSISGRRQFFNENRMAAYKLYFDVSFAIVLSSVPRAPV